MGSSVQPVDPVTAYLQTYGKGGGSNTPPTPTTGTDPVASYLQKYGKGSTGNIDLRQASDDTRVAPSKPSTGTPLVGLGAAESGLQGLLGGFADEIGGAGNAVINTVMHPSTASTNQFKSDYESYRDVGRGLDKGYAQAHPVAHGVAELAGGLLPAIATGGAGEGGLLARMGVGAATGAAFGGVGALGNAEGTPTQQFQTAAKALPAAAILGGMIPALGSAGGSLIAKLSGNSADQNALAKIATSLQQDQISPEVLAQRGADAAQTGAPMVAADLGGKNTAGLVRWATSHPSTFKDQFITDLEGRNAGQFDRIVQGANQATGNPYPNVTAARDALEGTRSANAAVNYPAAYAQGPYGGPILDQAMQSPAFAKAIGIGQKLADQDDIVQSLKNGSVPEVSSAPSTRIGPPTPGGPGRVYHGTGTAFDTFDPTKADPNALYGPGHYFTENPTVASSYATTKGAQVAPNVRMASLDIKQPFDADAIFGDVGNYDRVSDSPDISRILATAQRLRPNQDWDEAASMLDARADESNISGQDIYKVLSKTVDENGIEAKRAAANEILQQSGYDGITHIGGKGDPHRVWVAFSPDQIQPPQAAAAASTAGASALDRLSPSIANDPKMMAFLQQKGLLPANTAQSAASGVSIKALNFAKQYLDQGISRGFDANGGFDHTTATVTRDLLGQVLADAKGKVPEFANAIDTYASDSKPLNALDMGQQALRLPPDELTQATATMNPQERQGLVAGAMDALKNKGASVADKSDLSAQFLSNPAMRQRLQAITPTPQGFYQLMNLRDQEQSMARTLKAAVGGSDTERNRLLSGAMNTITGPDMAVAPISMRRAMMRVAGRLGQRYESAQNSKIADALGPYLQAPVGSQSFADFIQNLTQSGERQVTQNRVGQMGAALAGIGSGSHAQPSSP